MRTAKELVAEWSVWLFGGSSEPFFEKLTLEEDELLYGEFLRKGVDWSAERKHLTSLFEAVIEAQKRPIGIDEELIAGLSALGDLLDRTFVEEGEG